MSNFFLNIRPEGENPEMDYKVGVNRNELRAMLQKQMEVLRGYTGGAVYIGKTKTTKKINVGAVVEENLADFERRIQALIGANNHETVFFRDEIEEICEGINEQIQSIQGDIFRGCQCTMHTPYKLLGAEMNRLRSSSQEEIRDRHFVIRPENNDNEDDVLTEYSQYPADSVQFIADTLENISIPMIYNMIGELKEEGLIEEDEEMTLENFNRIFSHYEKFIIAVNSFIYKIRQLAFAYKHCSFELLRVNILHELNKFREYAEKIQDDSLKGIFCKFAGDIYGTMESITRDDFEMYSAGTDYTDEIKKYSNLFKEAAGSDCDHPAMIFLPGKIGKESDNIAFSEKEKDFCEQQIRRIASDYNLNGIREWGKKNIKDLAETVNNRFHAGYRLRGIVDMKFQLGVYYNDLEVEVNFDDDDDPVSQKPVSQRKKHASAPGYQGFRSPPPSMVAFPIPESVRGMEQTRESPKIVLEPSITIKSEPPAKRQHAAPAQKVRGEDQLPVAVPIPASAPEEQPEYNTLESKLGALKELYKKMVIPPAEGEKEARTSKMIIRIIESVLAICEDPEFAAITSPQRKERLADFALRICVRSTTKSGGFNINGVDMSTLLNEVWELSHAGNTDKELIPVLGGIKSILDKMDAKVEELKIKLRENEGQRTAIETLRETINGKNALIENLQKEMEVSQKLLAQKKMDRDRLQEDALSRGEMPDEEAEKNMAADIRELMSKLIGLARTISGTEEEINRLNETLASMHENHSPDPDITNELEKVKRDRAELLSKLSILISKYDHA